MNYFKNERVAAFDTDNTLVLWNLDNKKLPGCIKIKNPHDGPEKYFYLKPHKKHVEMLKAYKRAGYFIIVWSNGAAAWSKEVVEALDISSFVDLIITKPLYIFDDLPIEDALGQRRFFEDTE